ncbi:hypothetical protein GCM10027168_53120 [Streptomyces capparidis]
MSSQQPQGFGPPSGYAHPAPGHGHGYGYGPGAPQQPPHGPAQPYGPAHGFGPPQGPGFGPPGAPVPPAPAPGRRGRTGAVVACVAGALGLGAAGVFAVPALLGDSGPEVRWELRRTPSITIQGGTFVVEEERDPGGRSYEELSADGSPLERVNPTYRPKAKPFPHYAVSGAYGDIADPEEAMSAQMADKLDRGFRVVGEARTFDPRAEGAGDVPVRCVVMEKDEEYFAACGWANRSTMGMVGEFREGADGTGPEGLDLERLAERTIDIRDGMQVEPGAAPDDTETGSDPGTGGSEGASGAIT